MRQQSAASTYARTAIESAPPLKIVHMMYEGALRFLEQAEAIDPRANPAEFSKKLNRADAIVSELRISLDPSPSPELAQSLTRLYLFADERIRDAVMEGDASLLPAVRDVLSTLLSGWKQLEVEGPKTAQPPV